MLRLTHLALGLAFACTLAACGGGGGGSKKPVAPPVNTAPTFGPSAFNVTEDSVLTATVTATDAQGQAITFSTFTIPAHGTVTGLVGTGNFTYTPAPNYFGPDHFLVSAIDSGGAQNLAEVTITVTGVYDAPTIRDDVITTTGIAQVIDVLANDSNPDTGALTLTLVGAPDFGTATIANGKVELTMPAGFQGFNTFTYKALDAAGGGSTARVAVFTDAQPVRFFYLTNEEGAYARNIYADDLISRRKVTSFTESTPTAMGSWMFVSDNGRTILYDELDATPASLGRRFWTAAAANGSSAPKRINASLTAGQSVELVSQPSPDGKWVVYRISHTTAETRYFLADLTTDAAPREILAPAGALRIDASSNDEIAFDPTSQYLVVPVRMPLPNGQQGTTLYRSLVTDPSALQPYFSAAEPNREVYTLSVHPDVNRALVVVYAQSGAQLFITRATDPTHPVAVSPLVLDPNMMGSVRADWAHERLLFNIDTQPQISPYASTLYVTNLVTAAWTSLGNLPADFTRPEFEDVHPSDNTVLITTTVNDPVTGIADLALEVDLVAGLPSREFARRNDYLGPRYTRDGATVMLVPIGGSVETFPRSNPSQSKSHFTAAYASNYRSSPDGQILSASAVDSLTDNFSDSIWAFNQTSSTGTFAKRLVKVPLGTKPFTYVSVGAIAPRY